MSFLVDFPLCPQTHKQVLLDIKELGERKHAEKECHKAFLIHFPESFSGPSQKR